jgi:DNA-binding MarR family transcriptional regulator
MTQIEETVTHALAQLCKAHRYEIDSALRRELSLRAGQEMMLLQLLADDGISQSQLVERLCVEPPTVTKMIQRMEEQGFVERSPDANDARVMRVYVTERGRAMHVAMEQCWMDVDRRATHGMTPEERALLRRLLIQMRDNLGA